MKWVGIHIDEWMSCWNAINDTGAIVYRDYWRTGRDSHTDLFVQIHSV